MIDWPSREEWAEERRTPYYDHFENLITNDINAYASPEEIAAALAALREIWCRYGRQMKAAQSGSKDEYWYRRRLINEVRKSLCEGRYHSYVDWVLQRENGDVPALAVIKKRYDAAKAAAEQKVHEDVAATPIDDAAWEEELQRRRGLDHYFNNPAARIKDGGA
jgi:hypothetical protein